MTLDQHIGVRIPGGSHSKEPILAQGFVDFLFLRGFAVGSVPQPNSGQILQLGQYRIPSPRSLRLADVIRFYAASREFHDSEETASMRSLVLLLFGIALCADSAPSQTEPEVRDRIVGTWKLVSAEETMRDGTTRPFPAFGPHGKGFLMYQRDGYMCGDLVNPDRPKWADPAHTTPEEKAAAADGTFAYCGKYEIDVKQQRIVHLPEVATDPGYVGSRQVRPYRLEGNRLILSDVEKDDPSVARWKIVWEKVQ